MRAGFPHSDICGSKLVCQLPAAFRRLPRPSSPVIAKASTTCTCSLDPIALHTSLRLQALSSCACLSDYSDIFVRTNTPPRAHTRRRTSAPTMQSLNPMIQHTTAHIPYTAARQIDFFHIVKEQTPAQRAELKRLEQLYLAVSPHLSSDFWWWS